MKRSSWLKGWWQGKQSAQRRSMVAGGHVAGRSETFETRQLLSVSALFIPATGELNVQLDGDDSVRLSATTAGNVLLEASSGGGAFTPINSIGTVAASNVQSIVILGSDEANTIDLNGVTAAAFTANPTIEVEGANGDDTLLGSPDLADSLLGGDGNDSINGQGGNDTIVGSSGSDSITAGTGDDSIRSGDGQDTITGDAGNDTIDSGDGDDTVSGGDGNDSVFAGNGQDSLNGDAGDDTLNGDGGTDTVSGDADNDSILGGELADSLLGGDGNDTINGQGGNDTIDGQAGDDSLLGGVGLDSLVGNDGNDFVNGGVGDDTAAGDAGNDTLLGGAGNDSLNGGLDNDTVQGQAGNDTLVDSSGADRLDGGIGSDLLDTRLVTLSIDNVQIPEGNSGTRQLTFTISLSGALAVTVTVDYATSSDGTLTGGTATAGTDYTATSNSVTFLPGQVTQQVSVAILVDTLAEADETFFITLSNPVNAVIFDGSGEGRILNDDSAPTGGLQPTVFPGGGTITPTGPHQLSTGTGDASVNVGVDGYGTYGSRLAPNGTNAIYDPVGPVTPSGTTWESGLAFRVGPTGTREFLTSGSISGSGGLARPTITGTTTDAISTFSRGGLDFSLAQSVDPLNDNTGMRTGSILTQTYTIMNPTGSNIDFELIRFMEGDLLFDGSITDGGGRLVTAAGDELMFETDAGGSSATNTTFVGISSIGGTMPATNRFELNVFSAFGNRIVAGNPLGDVINGDTDGDGFVNPGNEADIGLALRNTFSLVAGATTTYTTHTLFGTGVPSNVGTTPPPPPPPAPPPPLPSSNGPDTLSGGDGNDTLLAGDTDDFINAGAGDDLVFAGSGNNSVLGGAGKDTLNGEAGDDTLNGQGGSDTLIGGLGDDTLVLDPIGGGDDSGDGGDGFNTIQVTGTNAADTITVGQLGGVLVVGIGGGTISATSNIQCVLVDGANGNDIITIGSIDTVAALKLDVRGGLGNDLLDATGANIGRVRMSLSGNGGNDTLNGSLGNDTLDGGSGDDSMCGYAGNDTMIGGTGNDSMGGSLGNDSINGGDGADSINGQQGDDRIDGGLGNDTLKGDDGNDTLLGGVGDDNLNGMAGNDSILGGVGADGVVGGVGNDTLDGGRNNDTISGNAGDDKIRGDHGNDYINAGDGSNTVNGGDGDDTIISGLGNDFIHGGDGNDLVNSDDGDDIVVGGDGNDTILGGGGQDIVLGGDGDDSINGQGGTDTIAGQQGNDVIVDPVAEIHEAFTLSAGIIAILNAL